MESKYRLIALFCLFLASSSGLQANDCQASQGLTTGAVEFSDPSSLGPYQVLSYTGNLADSGYRSAIVHYPLGAGPFPATTLTGGYTNTKEQLSWLATHLASHGIITITFTPTNTFSVDAGVWARGHISSIATLNRENARTSSPIQGQVDIGRLAVMGYSYGGAGSVLAANQLGTSLRAALPLHAYQPVVPRAPIPFFFLSGTRDTVASPRRIFDVFQTMNSQAPRAFANISGLDHFGPLNYGREHDVIALFVTSWLRFFLADDASYETFFNGDALNEMLLEGDVFADRDDYLYFESN